MVSHTQKKAAPRPPGSPEVRHQKIGPLCLQRLETNGVEPLLQVAALALQGAAQLSAHRAQQCLICAGHQQQRSGYGILSDELPVACSAMVLSLHMLCNGGLGPPHCRAAEQPMLRLQRHACMGAMQAAGLPADWQNSLEKPLLVLQAMCHSLLQV